MGKGRKHKLKKNFAEKRREKQKKKDEWDHAPHHSYADIIRENKLFESYYKTQEIVPKDQWDSFMNTMKKNLPVAFRITGSKSEAKALLETIKGDFFKEILNTSLEDESENSEEAKDILQCLPFYPDGLAWQLQLTRKDIRRSEAYFRLHNFLIVETDCGSISRQEVVSMVPPLVLDVKPSHKILDMCAAPGSKTAQLIEMVHSEEGCARPEGFVIANELDHNRCYMLVHQAKRLNSPVILITNHDASELPNLMFTKPDGTKESLRFDRILADVPCSGDGTMRKNPDIWCKWSPASGNNLHGIQYRIARRGLELLDIGGRMVYSTCSLNPIENEAVLHRLLLETEDSVQIVDGRNFVPGLVCDPGVSHWLPASKDLQYYKSWEDVPEKWQTQVRPKMFPPKPEDASKFHFERCMRILPHHQDTGGFFVAVLEKVKPLPWELCKNNDNCDSKEDKIEFSLEEEEENDKKKDVTSDKRPLDEEKPQGPRRKRRKQVTGFREDPFVFFKDDKEDVWQSIKSFYDITDELDPKCLLVRNFDRNQRNIYYTSPEIRNVIISNEDQIKLINTGVKSFVRCNKNMVTSFRLAWEGLQTIVKYIGDARRVRLTKDDLIMLLKNNNPMAPPLIASLNPETRERLKHFVTGSCILLYEEKEAENPNPLKLQMVGWKGTTSLRTYIPMHDAIHYLRLLGVDCSKFEKNKFQENRDSLAPEEMDNGESSKSEVGKTSELAKSEVIEKEDVSKEITNNEIIKKEDALKEITNNDVSEKEVIVKEVTNNDVIEKEVTEKDDIEKVIKKEATEEVVKMDTEEVIVKEDIKEVVKMEATEEFVKKENKEETIRKEDSEQVIKKDDTKEVIKKEDTQEAIEKEDTKEIIEKEDIKEVTKKEDILKETTGKENILDKVTEKEDTSKKGTKNDVPEKEDISKKGTKSDVLEKEDSSKKNANNDVPEKEDSTKKGTNNDVLEKEDVSEKGTNSDVSKKENISEEIKEPKISNKSKE
ncbi:tRNA (cytosine(34)-C(5))-methyltransferase Nsun2 [Ptiloglossa arizonensis]|uniref:tRNA (cytosine(34)-C(5))-methyltransferase Nsun2 n=1 Tax=Ptiloglossa arizonensis TaxID=3350558 RepID=UPI003FA00D66